MLVQPDPSSLSKGAAPPDYVFSCSHDSPFCHSGFGHALTGFEDEPSLDFPFLEEGELVADTDRTPPPRFFLGALAATAKGINQEY